MIKYELPPDVPKCQYRTGLLSKRCFCHAPGIKPLGQQGGLPVLYDRCRKCPIPHGTTPPDSMVPGNNGHVITTLPSKLLQPPTLLLLKEPKQNSRKLSQAMPGRPQRILRRENRQTRLKSPCVHLGQVLRIEPCSCSNSSVEVYACALLGECVLTRVKLHNIKSKEQRFNLASKYCEDCQHYKEQI